MSVIIDFDNIEGWLPSFEIDIRTLVSDEVIEYLKYGEFELIDDVVDELFRHVDRGNLSELAVKWIKNNNLVCYHGTRLTDEEICVFGSHGLSPLRKFDRKARITRALSSAEGWSDIEPKLDERIEEVAESYGNREGLVCAAMSLSFLKSGQCEYLKYGSEFDQRFAQRYFKEDGLDLLSRDGSGVIVSLSVPGSDAIRAAHDILGVEELINRGDLPNLAGRFIQAWCVQVSSSSIQFMKHQVDDSMNFRERIPASWILGLRKV